MNETILFIINEVERELDFYGWSEAIKNPAVKTYIHILSNQMPESEFKAFMERIRNEYKK